MLKLKLQYFGHLMRRADSLEKKKPWCWERLKAGEEGDDRGWDGRMVWWTWVWVNSRSWWWTGRPGVLKSMGSQRVGRDWATELKGMKPTFIKHLAALRAEDDALQHRRPFLKEFDSYNITGQWFRLKNLPCRIHGLQSRAISRRCSLQIARSGGTPAVCLVKLYLTVWSVGHVRLLATPWTVAHQAPLSVGFSRQEFWSGSPFPSPGDLPDPGIQLRSPTLQADFFYFYCLSYQGRNGYLLFHISGKTVSIIKTFCRRAGFPFSTCNNQVFIHEVVPS